jgi:hypothetical protein
MKYYGIVSKIKDEHKTGVYGRKKLDKKDYKNLKEEFANYDWIDGALLASRFLFSLTTIGSIIAAKKIISRNRIGNQITFKTKIDSKNKTIIIPNTLLENNYNLDNDYAYGLLDEFSFKNKAFEILMKSKGGATLNIFERNDLPENLKHFGGKLGSFTEGLYILHPKNEDILIPLNNSNNLIQSMILEETVSAYEALGAKSITIIDLTKIDAELGGKKGKVEAKANSNYTNEVLREKEFGKGVFDPERALSNKLFIHDIPSVMTTIEARIKGNQTLESFTENINLSIGLDVNVLELFSANSKFNYQRKWSFKVEFYDKNEN